MLETTVRYVRSGINQYEHKILLCQRRSGLRLVSWPLAEAFKTCPRLAPRNGVSLLAAHYAPFRSSY